MIKRDYQQRALNEEYQVKKRSKEQAALDKIMRTHKLSSTAVGKIISRDPVTIRKYRSGLRPMPPEMLQLLKWLISK